VNALGFWFLAGLSIVAALGTLYQRGARAWLFAAALPLVTAPLYVALGAGWLGLLQLLFSAMMLVLFGPAWTSSTARLGTHGLNRDVQREQRGRPAGVAFALLLALAFAWVLRRVRAAALPVETGESAGYVNLGLLIVAAGLAVLMWAIAFSSPLEESR
jgi:hypothetical protein